MEQLDYSTIKLEGKQTNKLAFIIYKNMDDKKLIKQK